MNLISQIDKNTLVNWKSNLNFKTKKTYINFKQIISEI